MALLDRATAMRHAKVSATNTDDDTLSDLDLKVIQAEAIVIGYIQRPDHTWTDATDPEMDEEFAIVQAAILKVFLNLWRFRGDTERIPDGAPLTEDVRLMLAATGLRDPSLA